MMRKKILILSILSMFVIMGATVVSVAGSRNMVLEDVGMNNPPEIECCTIKGNQPPNAPTIDGPTSGKPGVENTYIINTTDPDGDEVSYYIDWGDGNFSGWTRYRQSGSEFHAPYTWAEQGTYTIGVKAKDESEAESDWTYLEISIPRNNYINEQLILKILERITVLKNP